jgi:hypothetical protein
MGTDIASRKDRLTGLPSALRPTHSRARFDRFELVTDGPRHLGYRPFDYRNPFPVKDPVREDTPGFEYLANGNALLGLPGGPDTAWVDASGVLRMYTGGWAVGLGPAGDMPAFGPRTVSGDAFPELRAEAVHGGLRWRFSWFAAPIPGGPRMEHIVHPDGLHRWVGAVAPVGPLPCYVAQASVVYDEIDRRYPAEAHLCYRQAAEICAGSTREARPWFAPTWEHTDFEPLGDGRFLLTTRVNRQKVALGLLLAPECEIDNGTGSCGPWPDPLPGAPPRSASRSLVLRRQVTRGETLVFTWILPGQPVAAGDDACLRLATVAGLREAAAGAWAMSARPTRLDVGEAKPRDCFRQAQRDLDLCRVTLGSSTIPTAGPSGGSHDFRIEEAAAIVHAFDLTGDHARAEAMLDHFCLHEASLRNAGPALWAFGRHYALTRDAAWLARSFSDVKRFMTCLVLGWASHRDDHGGLLPGSDGDTAERVRGHLIGHHLQALAGAEEAVRLAKARGDAYLAQSWQAFTDTFRQTVLDSLAKTVKHSDGLVTPAFEGLAAPSADAREDGSAAPTGTYGETGGIDALNLTAVYPAGLLAPDHPWVTSSLSRWGNNYVEGLLPCPEGGDYRRLHPGLTLLLAETWLRRGDYCEALRDLYGVLLHATAAGSIPGVIDSARRTACAPLPDAVASARFIRFMRHMLAYEGHDGRLHLLAGLAPAWMAPGSEILLENAPTGHGTLSMRGRFENAGLRLDLLFQPCDTAGDLMLHLPPFLRDIHVKAGADMAMQDGAGWRIPPGTRNVRVWWRDDPLPALSFESVAQAWRTDYTRRIAEET